MAFKQKKPLNKRQPEVGRLFRRDKYGRFAKSNRLGITKRRPAPQRDKYGRFVARANQRQIYRDKRGRFAKARLPWYKTRYAALALVILGLCGAIFSAYQLNKPIVVDQPVAASPSQTVQTEQPTVMEVAVVMPKSEPTRLRIDKIGVNTSFVELGRKADGTIEVPKSPYVVGWYNLAPTPGEMGPAVVIGHVDRPGGTGVFWRLRELVAGDTFEIDRADGSTVKFKVDDVKQFPQEEFPTEEVYGNIDHAGIRLITCGGTYIRSIKRYTHNTIVYASLVVETQPNKTASAL